MADKKPKKLPKKLIYWTRRDRLEIIKAWARNGLTDADIAKNMGIARSTLYEYRKKSEILDAAMRESKEIADLVIENALYETAKRGNVTAMIYWLNNRRPDRWRNKPIESGDRDGGGVVILPERIDNEQ